MAWRWEGYGGFASLIFIAVNALYNYYDAGYWARGFTITLVIFGVPAILFIICWISLEND